VASASDKSRTANVPPTVTGRPPGAPLPSLQELPAEFQGALPKMRLDALVYGRGDAGAMAFINGRKYVVGDTINGDVTVERITDEGAVLTYQGQRFLLRQ
jgi:hypothetical protein